MSPLPPRLAQVRALVEHGWRDKEIARIQGVCIGTVKAQVHELLMRLGVRNRTELAGLPRVLEPVWQPTSELRWVGPKGGRPQQRWTRGIDSEWRDVSG